MSSSDFKNLCFSFVMRRIFVGSIVTTTAAITFQKCGIAKICIVFTTTFGTSGFTSAIYISMVKSVAVEITYWLWNVLFDWKTKIAN